MKLVKSCIYIFYKYIFIAFIVTSGFIASASTTDGTIDSTYHSALLCTNDVCTTTTQINFKPTLGTPIHVTDTAITGHAWSETFGWINLNPTLSGVTNTTSGVLGGYAWGDGAGWINFSPTLGGVTINTSGQFVGWAWSENYGWIKFDCLVTNACVTTDWRPLSTRVTTSSHTSSNIISSPIAPVVVDDKNNNLPSTEKGIKPTVHPVVEPTLPPEVTEPTTPPEVMKDGSTDVGTGPTPRSLSQSLRKVLGYFNEVIYGFLKQSGEIYVDSINKAGFIVRELAKNIADTIDTPVGSASSKIIATTGLISGAYISVTTVLFSNPLTFSEIFLIPIRLWGLLLVAFGIKKRNLPWGTVYDSVTKQPLDPAYVILQDLNGNEVATSITDLDGRYGFLVPAGSYKLIANKTNYKFPSTKLEGKDIDTIYNNLYFDQIIEVKDGEVINNNIPLDPLKFDWNEFAKRDQNVMRFFSKREVWIARISDILFVLGLILSIIAVTVSPKLYNIIIFAVYIVMLLLRRTILKPKSFGSVKYKVNENPLSFAIMRIFFANTENEIMHKVTDKTGKYYCILPNGTYYTKIENKNLDESYSLVHTSEPIEVKKGYINKVFEV